MYYQIKTNKTMYKIIDWAGNRMFKDKTFNTFEDGWGYIYENVDNTAFDESGKLGDDCYQEYYVVLND